MLEFQTLASWAPVYFGVLGVPLSRVGLFTVPPVVIGMAGKVGVTMFEAALLKRQVGRLRIRKLSNTIASVSVMLSTTGFALVRSPVAACVMYCCASAGHCFDCRNRRNPHHNAITRDLSEIHNIQMGSL